MLHHPTTILEKHLTSFREAYPLSKVEQENNKLIYFCPLFYNAMKAAEEARKLIERLGLPLVVNHAVSNHFFTVTGMDF